MRSLIDLVRRTTQRLGYDLRRHRPLKLLLSRHGVTTVLDVGANVGQFARTLRQSGYKGRIISFEPQRAAYEALTRSAASDPAWQTVHLGLGRAEAATQINLYLDPCMGSLLTLREKEAFADGAQAIGQETIHLKPLDAVYDEHVSPTDLAFLKIDTQGFERDVILGAERTLPRLVGVQLELSLTPIYENQPPLEEVIALLRGKGFMLWQLERGFCDQRTGRQFEADGFFLNEKYLA